MAVISPPHVPNRDGSAESLLEVISCSVDFLVVSCAAMREGEI
jgi:hypothetical protein